MTVTDTLARDNGALDINTGTTESPIYTPVGGINTWSPSPTVNKADTSKFSDGGRKTNMSVSTEDSFTFGGFRQVDEATGERDPGQLACEIQSRKLGQASRAEFRHSRPGGKVSTFTGTVTVTDGGGGNDDPDAWQVEIQVSGDIDTGTPDLPTVVTSVAGDGDVLSAEITWTDGAEAGDLFEVTIYALGEPVKQVLASEDPVLVQLPAGTYTARVRAGNVAGWSSLSAPSANIIVTAS